MIAARTIIGDQLKKGNYKDVSESALSVLEKDGWIKLPLGSYYGWMIAEWFAKALEEHVLLENQYGQFVPSIPMRKEKRLIGKRGREEIYEEETTLDFIAFNAFVKRYEGFLKAHKFNRQALDALAS